MDDHIIELIKRELSVWERKSQQGFSAFSPNQERDTLVHLWSGVEEQPPRHDETSLGRGCYPTFTSALAACLWLEDHAQVIYEAVCVRFAACKRIAEISTDHYVAATAVADLLLGCLGLIPAVTTSVLLVKCGLNHVCGCKDGKPIFKESFWRSLTEKHTKAALGPQPSARYEAYEWVAALYINKGKFDLARARLADAEDFVRLVVPDPIGTGNDLQLTGSSLGLELNNIAYEYLRIPDLDHASRLLEEAVSLDARNPGILDSLALCRYKQGRLEEARSFSEQALADLGTLLTRWGTEGVQECRYHLASILRSMGDDSGLRSLLTTMESDGGAWCTKAKDLLTELNTE